MNRHLLWVGALVVGLAATFAAPATADQLAQAAAPSPTPSATPTPNPLQWSGYIDTGFEQSSAWGQGGAISGRVFDNVSGQVQLNDVNFTAAYNGPIGGKIELNVGTDPDVFHSYPQAVYICPQGPTFPGVGVFPCGPPFNIQGDLTQAYLSGSLGKFTLIAGKFETLAGAEVIESPNDLEYSRSILFGYAVPFTHTGLRLTYAATPQISVIVGANRGWDTTGTLSTNALATIGAPATYKDGSNYTAEFGLAYNPSSAFSLTAQAYSGQPENQAYVGCLNFVAGVATNCNRSLIDAVATWHVNSALTLMANVDDGNQSNTTAVVCAAANGCNVKWEGAAGYVSYVWNPSITTSLRAEVFNDNQGYRTGFGLPVVWREGTGTVQFNVTSHWIARAEMRLDGASAPIFAASYGTGKPNTINYMKSLGLELIGKVP